MSLTRLFERRFRGFRVIEISALAALAVLVLWVYFAKTSAGGERAQITTVEAQIADEKARLRLLDAEVAHLERPRRVAHLAEGYLGLKPISADRETTVDALATVAATRPRVEKAPAT
jgi:cell division protein FtsL